MGDLRGRTLIITHTYILSTKDDSAIYIARSYHGESYTATIKFTDDIGKYEVGDTIKIIKS